MVVDAPGTTRGRGWAVVVLHDFGDGLSVKALHTDFSRYCPDGRFYFPAVLHEHVDPSSPMASYVFVALVCEAQIVRLPQSSHVASVLRDTTGKLSVVTDEELATMVRAQPRVSVRAGQRVAILSGDWSGLDGEVLKVKERQVHVLVTLCSRTRELVVDRSEVKVL